MINEIKHKHFEDIDERTGILLFYEPNAEGARGSEKIFNPDITQVKVTINGIPNKVYCKGMKMRDMWDEVYKRFGKENSSRHRVVSMLEKDSLCSLI